MGISFRTEIDIQKPVYKIDYSSQAMFIGSCFSDHIGGELKRLKFPVLLNPFGVLYNPASIASVLKMLIGEKRIGKNDLIFHDHKWHSFLLHGSFSHPKAEVVIEKGNKALAESYAFLKKASYLFVTFGTAWVFNYKKTGNIVSNCHKIPAVDFERYRLDVSQIVDQWNEFLIALHQFNPNLKIVFTISPVRHMKDGAHENQLSKATLFLATHQLNAQVNNTSYFPSYEIVHDELRDYRFYAPDMVHVADVAVKYIFEKFANTFFNDKTIRCKNEMLQLVKALEHRVEGNTRQNIELFKESMLKKIRVFEEKYTEIDFQFEKNYFEML